MPKRIREKKIEFLLTVLDTIPDDKTIKERFLGVNSALKLKMKRSEVELFLVLAATDLSPPED